MHRHQSHSPRGTTKSSGAPPAWYRRLHPRSAVPVCRKRSACRTTGAAVEGPWIAGNLLPFLQAGTRARAPTLAANRNRNRGGKHRQCCTPKPKPKCAWPRGGLGCSTASAHAAGGTNQRAAAATTTTTTASAVQAGTRARSTRRGPGWRSFSAPVPLSLHFLSTSLHRRGRCCGAASLPDPNARPPKGDRLYDTALTRLIRLTGGIPRGRCGGFPPTQNNNSLKCVFLNVCAPRQYVLY
jgi:hypothetical protein